MARLRIRIELNRGGLGVPLEKLAKLVHETHAFLDMLARDIRIEVHRGEWIGFQFDSECLNFTAEFIGPVSSEHVLAFNKAFDGVTSLRRVTIAQFARIAESIEGDELVGFGLYEHDEGDDPDEWRCLSKRDALRITEEMRTLLAASEGEVEGEAALPAAVDKAVAARYFRGRRDRNRVSGEPNRLDAVLSDVENRVVRLEKTVIGHDEAIGSLRSRSNQTEETFFNLLKTVEGFCDKATRRIEQLSPPSPSDPGRALTLAPPTAELREIAASPGISIETGGKSEQSRAATSVAPETSRFADLHPQPVSERDVASSELASAPKPGHRPLIFAAAAVLLLVISSIVIYVRGRSQPTGQLATSSTQSRPPVKAADPAGPASSQVSAAKSEVQPSKTTVRLSAVEPVWLSVMADDKHLFDTVLETGVSRTIEFRRIARLRVGNAGGLNVDVNGRQLPPLGPRGKVRVLQFNEEEPEVIVPK